jgi:YesN/AraC family two-component response regulator
MTLKMAKQFRCDITPVDNPFDALELVSKEDFDLVLSDYRMSGVNGVDLLTRVKERTPKTARILITGYSDIATAMAAINQAEVHNYIEKPWDNDNLRDVIHAALKRKEEREAVVPTSEGRVKNVEESLKVLAEFQKKISAMDEDPQEARDILDSDERLPQRKMVFEFKTSADFNRFSFEIRKMRNVHIIDTYVFEDKYVINVFVDPKSVSRIM